MTKLPRGRAARPQRPWPRGAGRPDQGCKAGVKKGATRPAHACTYGVPAGLPLAAGTQAKQLRGV